MRKITITPKDVVRQRVALRDFNRMLLKKAENCELIPKWLTGQGESLYCEYMRMLRDYAVLCGREKRKLEKELKGSSKNGASHSGGQTGVG